jgi:hypothetical protein
MSKLPHDTEVWFRDVTEDSEACQVADNLPEWRTGFENLGFRRVGFLAEYQLPGGAFWVHEVQSSPKGDAFLTLALLPDHPLRNGPRSIPSAILESGLEDGSIIITTTNPKHLWRLNHPKAGFYLEGRSEATPEELWRRHQQRVKNLVLGRDSSVLRHVSMPLRLWIAQRSNEVGNYIAVVAFLLGFVTFVWMLISICSLKGWLDAWARVWFGVFWPLFWLVGFFAIVLVGGWIVRSRVVRAWLAGQWFARQFPWPKRRRYDPVNDVNATRTHPWPRKSSERTLES